MNQFDIGESMGNMGNLQSVPEDPESTQFGHASPINYGNNDDDNQDDFENSHSTINDNPFTKKSNFLAYHTLEKDEDRPSMVNENIKYSATNKISNKVSFSPNYHSLQKSDIEPEQEYELGIRDNTSGSKIFRPFSAKHSDRYVRE